MFQCRILFSIAVFNILFVLIKILFILPRSTCDISNGIDNQAPSNSVIQNTFCIHVVNGESTASPSHVAARPKNTPVPKPLTTQPANNTGKNEQVVKHC